jgi:HSP20 family molecular chaperone IbpA
MGNLIKRDNNSIDMFDDAVSEFFRPMFYDIDFDSMKTDIKDNETSYCMEIEMPGFDKSDILITLDNGYVTVQGQKKEAEESKKGNYIKRERSFSCQRSYYVGDISESDIKAKYSDGILKIDMPKTEQNMSSHKIAVE